MQPAECFVSRQLYHRYYAQPVAQLLKQQGLSRIELDVMLFLYNNPGYNKAKDIVELRGIAKSYVSKAVELLVQKQLLIAQQDKTDRRQVQLSLTPQGQEIAQQARALQQQLVDQMLEGVSSQELASMRKLIHQLADNFRNGMKP